MLRHSGMTLRESAYVRLINNRVLPRDEVLSPFAVPVEVRIDHYALRYERRAVSRIEAEIFVFVPDGVAETGVVPLQRAGMGPRARVEQQLVGVEAMSCIRLVWPVHAVTVDGAGADVAHVSVPDLVRKLRKDDALAFGLAVRIEQAELDLRGVSREEREVRPGPVPHRATRKGHAAPRGRQLDIAHGSPALQRAFLAEGGDESTSLRVSPADRSPDTSPIARKIAFPNSFHSMAMPSPVRRTTSPSIGWIERRSLP